MKFAGRSAIVLVAGLAISVLLNFATIGYFSSGLFHNHNRPIAAERLVSLGAKSLPRELRRGIAEALAPHRDDLRAAFRAVRDARIALFEAMRAEPYDAAAVNAAFDNLQAELAAPSEIGQRAIIQALGQASPETRAAIEPPGRPRPPKR